MPKFSIIIPCYKVEAYIRECLDSVLAQKIDSWEAICTDDGSPDGTGAILDEYAARDERIRVIHQQNAGLSAARNAALEVATGEWLLYLDSDDVLSPWALETYVKMMEKFSQADILRAGMATSADGKWNWGPAEGDSVGMDVHDRVTMYGIDAYFVQMIFRRSVYGDIRFVGMSWCEERPYVAKCIARAKYVTDTPVVAYGFRVREGSITHRKMTLEEWMGYLNVTREMYDIFHRSGKRIDGNVVRLIVNLWLEGQLALLYSFVPREFHDIAWAKWFALLPDVCSIRGMTHWQNFVTRMCMLLQVRLVPIVLCWMPHWLKTKGVHR